MKVLQHPIGTTENNDQFTGAESQFTVDRERWELRLHDGVTPGGHRILNLQQLRLLFLSKDSEFGDVEFDPADKGYLVRIGDRQWVLRGIDPGTGILIENGLATAGNTEVAIDEDWLAVNGIAGRLVWGGDTAGDADAFTLTLPAAWTEVQGSVVAARFHVKPNDDATLSINGATSRPILFSTGASNISQGIDAETVVLFMRVGADYRMIGEQEVQVASGVVNFLQDFLIFGDPEEGWAFNNLNGVPQNPTGGTVGAVTHTNIDLQDGEARGAILLTTIEGTNEGWRRLFFVFAKIDGNYYVAPYDDWWGDSFASQYYNTHTRMTPSQSVYSATDVYRIGTRLQFLGETFSFQANRFWKTEKGQRAFT